MNKNNLELGQFIHWDRGQNYPFGACMAKLMECLGGDTALYTYNFFAGLAGDDFVMCYGDNKKFNDCVSVCADTEAFLARVCSMIGLEYRFVKRADWLVDIELYYGFVKQFIDRGIPILCSGAGENTNWSIYVCNLATNAGHGREFLEKAQELNCDLTFIPELIALFDGNTAVRNELEVLGGGFNVTLETLHDKSKAAAIADVILQLAETNEKIVRLFK